MRYNIDFSMAAIFNYALLLLVIKAQFRSKTQTIRQVTRMMVGLFIANMLDMITAYTISYSADVPVWLNYVLNLLFFEGELVCIAMVPVYIGYVLKNHPYEEKKFIKCINAFLVAAYGLICLSSPITHAIFYFDGNNIYHHGPLYFLEGILALYFLTYSLANLLINVKDFSRLQYSAIATLILLSGFGITLQRLFLPDTLITYFLCSIACFFALLVLETPDIDKLATTMSELEANRELLEIAKKREEETNSIIHQMTKSASWDLTLDKDYNLTGGNWSDEFFWMLGYNKEELGDKVFYLWTDSLHPDESERVLAAFTNGMMGKEEYHVTYRLRSKSGEYRWYRGNGEMKPDTFGDGYVYRGIIQDIHDEVIKEELTKEKLAAISQLEESQQALKEALEKAESADRAKSDFLASMSHEIRTPINAVLGMNELISRESTEPAIIEYSANVADAGQSLLSLINDILDFSKIEAGRMELAPADYELSGLLREVYNMINIRCQDKNLRFNIDAASDIPGILHGDEIRIRQILINILNNSVKYTDEGSVTLDVRSEQTSDNRIILVLKVKDTGIGIRKEDIGKLFDSFKRVDPTRTRKREGTGLGLSITKSFVELMGGTIDVDSVYGEGSVFTVRIPQIVVSNEPIGEFSVKAEHKKKKYEASFTAPDACILAVDDVATNLMVIRGLLKQTKIKVETVTSGEECLCAIGARKYDIILLDHMMPGMDGIETLNAMKIDPNHLNQDTPVIMLTANAILGVREEYLGIGFTDYLSKPVRADELETLLLKYLSPEKVTLKETRQG